MTSLLSHGGKPVPLLFSGFNPRAVVALCRFFVQNDIDFSIIARNEADPILKSDYGRRVSVIREDSSLSVEKLVEWKKTIGRDNLLILPTAEYLNRFLLNNREQLEQRGFLIPICEKSLYEEISDKLSFCNLCSKHGLRIPGQTDRLSDSTLSLPLVAKPTTYENKKGEILKPEILFTKRDFDAFKAKYEEEDFYFQEFIQGQCIYLLYYFSRNGEYAVYSQENFIQQANGLSMIAAESSGHYKEKISLDYATLLLEKKYCGFVMIELKGRPGNYCMIEANPRIWGPSQLLLDSGTDLIHRFALDYGLIDTIPEKKYEEGKKYFWSGGIFEDLKRGEKPVFHNYDEGRFFSALDGFFAADIYGRADTLQIFMEEKNG